MTLTFGWVLLLLAVLAAVEVAAMARLVLAA